MITGARRRCNLDSLYSEVSWPNLEQRRENHKITTVGKLVIKRFPNYLWQDYQIFYNNARANRINTFAVPQSAHEYYDKSFVPSSIKLWNQLPSAIRCINSYDALKARVKNRVSKDIPKYYYWGTRKLSILHTKLRLGCSDLMSDKYMIGIANSDLCTCGEVEDANHFLLECGSNLVSKVKMLDNITALLEANDLNENDIDIRLLLYGSENLSYESNSQIFSYVQTFIGESKRFV